jgi:hypothetical protein
MKLAVFIDLTERSGELIIKFQEEGYRIVESEYVSDELEKDCTEDCLIRVLIWHLSSSSIAFDDVDRVFTISDFDKARELLDGCQFSHKFGVTDNKQDYKKAFKSTGWFTAVESWAELNERFSGDIEKGLEGKEEIERDLKRYLLYIFLPLDIDMQALGEQESNSELYLNEMAADLEELYKYKKYAEEKRTHYRRKLYNIWRIIGLRSDAGEPVPEIKELNTAKAIVENKDLHELVGGGGKDSQIHMFLAHLDERLSTERNTAKVCFCKPFSGYKITVNGKERELRTFHDWYCALASCLHGEESCREETLRIPFFEKITWE